MSEPENSGNEHVWHPLGGATRYSVCKNPMYTPGNANTFNLQKQMVYFAYASV